MIHSPDGTLRFPPRDLIAYLEGDFAAWCDRCRPNATGTAAPRRPATSIGSRPTWTRSWISLARMGDEHESAT